MLAYPQISIENTRINRCFTWKTIFASHRQALNNGFCTERERIKNMYTIQMFDSSLPMSLTWAQGWTDEYITHERVESVIVFGMMMEISGWKFFYHFAQNKENLRKNAHFQLFESFSFVLIWFLNGWTWAIQFQY